jgi:predicted chitinase
MEGLPVSYKAHLLATVIVETGFTMQPVIERGARSYFNKYEPTTKKGLELGNTQAGDGFRYRGRGYVQITGKTNYRRATEATGVDLVNYPERALEPELAATILVKGCTEGWFTGKKLGNYLPGDYKNARRVVNGLDKADKIAGDARVFERALTNG